MSNLFWCLTEAEKAFEESQPGLARRYVDKALERMRCMYCHQELDPTNHDDYVPHFKGFLHKTCKEAYSGRNDYLRQKEGLK